MIAFLIICIIKDCFNALYQAYEYTEKQDGKFASFIAMIAYTSLVIWGFNLMAEQW